MQDWNEVYIGGYWVRGNYSIQYNTASESYIVRRDYNTSNHTIVGRYATLEDAKAYVGNA